MWFLIERDTATVNAIADSWKRTCEIYDGEDAHWYSDSDLDIFRAGQIDSIVQQAVAKLGYPMSWAIEGGRVRVFQMPAVGDKVSHGFNGDTYPCGVIVKVNKRMVVTDDGTTFVWKPTRNWFYRGGYSALMFGHISKQNPHF